MYSQLDFVKDYIAKISGDFLGRRVDPKRHIGDMVMKNRIELWEQQRSELKRENKEFETKCRTMNKALSKKQLNIVKKL